MLNIFTEMLDGINKYFEVLRERYPTNEITVLQNIGGGQLQEVTLPLLGEVGIFACSVIEYLSSEHGINKDEIIFNFLISKSVVGTEAYVLLAKNVRKNEDGAITYDCANFVFSVYFESSVKDKCSDNIVKASFCKAVLEINKNSNKIEQSKIMVLDRQDINKELTINRNRFF